jgi:integrase
MRPRTGGLVKRGRAWYVRWRVDGRAYLKALKDEKGHPITTKEKAEAAKDSFMARFRHGTEAEVLQAIAGRVAGLEAEAARLEEESAPSILIPDGWAAYLKAHDRPDTGAATLRQYGFQYQQWAAWMAKRHPTAKMLREVTQDHAGQFMDYLVKEKRTPNTINKYRGLLALVFRVLADKARIITNPWESIKPKGLKTESRRELNLAELRAVCEAATGDLRPLFAVGLYTGMRLGDCATLKWNEVDLERGIIRRIPNKSRKSKPVLIPIHPVLRGIIEEQPHQGEYVLPRIAKDYRRHSSYVTDRIQRHFEVCKIETKREDKTRCMAVVEVGFHSLRHSFVSLSRSADVPLSVVEAIIGHSNPAMTRHYTHTGEEASRAAIAALPSLIGDDKPAVVEKPEAEALKKKVREIAGRLTAKTAKAIRAELMELSSTSNPDNQDGRVDN